MDTQRRTNAGRDFSNRKHFEDYQKDILDIIRKHPASGVTRRVILEKLGWNEYSRKNDYLRLVLRRHLSNKNRTGLLDQGIVTPDKSTKPEKFWLTSDWEKHLKQNLNITGEFLNKVLLNAKENNFIPCDMTPPEFFSKNMIVLLPVKYLDTFRIDIKAYPMDKVFLKSNTKNIFE